MAENKLVAVRSVSEFLEQVQKRTTVLQYFSGAELFVYRGESQVFSAPGIPNLFRGNAKQMFIREKYFEKNVLDEFRSHKFSNGMSYLELAIDAQHGGFPSRLLDVSFNSLIALFFAVQKSRVGIGVGESTTSNAAVYIYSVDNLYSPASKNIQNFYDSIIGKEDDFDNRLSGYNHIFIDYIKSNKRIVAQNGGFILFPGNEFIPFPEYRTRRILVDGSKKKEIAGQLEKLFGITIGSIYPESITNVPSLTKKAVQLSNSEITTESDRTAFLGEFEMSCGIYEEKVTSLMSKLAHSTPNSLDERKLLCSVDMLLREIEHFLLTSKTTYLDQLNHCRLEVENSFVSEKLSDLASNFIANMNDVIDRYNIASDRETLFSIENIEFNSKD